MRTLFIVVIGTLAMVFASFHYLKSHFAGRTPQTESLLTTSLKNFADDIYQAGTSLGRIPLEILRESATEFALPAFILTLPMESEAKGRIISRLRDDRYMTHLIPFVWSLKEFYTPPENLDTLTFDHHMRTNFNDRQVPGGEHDYFKWVPEQKAAAASTFSVSRELIGKFLEFYDVLFVQGDFDTSLAADLDRPYKRIDSESDPVVQRSKPKVRELLEFILKTKLSGGESEEQKSSNEIAQAVENLLKDEHRLEAVTITLVDFIRMMAKKSYRMFASRELRRMDYEKWLARHINARNFDVLKHYLTQQMEQRKYAVHIVVDGLQGELLRSLAGGQPGLRYLKALQQDFRLAEAQKPRTEPTNPPNHKHTLNFLNHIVANGYRHPLYLPFFRELYASYPLRMAQMGISTTPTISVRNLPIAKTGANVAGYGGTGIPNFHFVDRKKNRAFYFFGNDAILLDELTAESGMRSMFERLNGFSTMNCHAQYDWHSHESFEALANLGLGETLRDIGDVMCLERLKAKAAREPRIQELRRELLDTLVRFENSNIFYWPTLWRASRRLAERLTKLEDQGLPQYLLYYSPWPDHFAHFVGPYSDEIISPTGELNRLDYWLGNISEVYKRAGLEHRTLFAMAGDHGLSPIFHQLNPEVQVLEKLAAETKREIVIEKISSDEGEGPKINHSIKPKSMHNIDVVIASTAGGNYMMDFFHQGDRWVQQPLYRDLVSWTPLSGGQPMDMIHEISTRLKETLEYLVVREEPSDPDRTRIRLVAHREGRRHDEFIYRNGDRIFYKESPGYLLGLNKVSRYRASARESDLTTWRRKCITSASELVPDSWCTEAEWRELTFHTDRPDGVVQLAHLYDEDRAGTVNLFPLPGIGYNTKVPGRHAGESFHEKDAFVGIWGLPVFSGTTPLRSAVNGSIAPTLYEHLTGESATAGENGWGFPSLSDD